MTFLLGLFAGGILGMFLTAVVTAGKMADCQSHEEYLRKKLEFRMHGSEENAND
jgi:hypothetical protein